MNKYFITIILLAYFIFTGNISAKVLDLPLALQEQDQWCWAAVSTSILSYYNFNVQQCEVAEYARVNIDWHDFGDVDCCIDPRQGCNYWNYNWGYPGSIEDILRNWNVQVNNFSRHLSKQEVISEINSDKPFIIRWGWNTGGGHFVNGYGIDNSMVSYMDPWISEGHKTALYSWVVSGGNHKWTHTQTMKSPPIESFRSLSVNSTGTSGVSITATPSTYSGTTNYTKSNIPIGTPITLTAPATSGGANFSSWTGCDWSNTSANRTCTVNMMSNKTVTANYSGGEPAGWKSEVGIINPAGTPATGTLRGFNSAGAEVWSQSVPLPANGRMELDVTTTAGTSASQIKSMRFDISSGQAVGYQKFSLAGKYRVGLEASPLANQKHLFVPHIASNDSWWTGIGLTNTTNADKDYKFTFDTGQQAEMQLGAGGHDAFTIASLFGGGKQPDIGAAQVSDGAGMVGLMLFGGDNVLSGVSLSDATASTLYFPHVAHNNEWWTGLVVYNPGDETANLILTYFDAQGVNLGSSNAVAGPGQRMVGAPDNLNFPDGTAWFMVQASQPVTGFELFGTTDGNQLGGYSVVNLTASSGVFPKLERNGWTGIAFVNPGESAVQVQVQARTDAGSALAVNTVDFNPGQKLVAQAAALFPDQDISSATFISFTASGDVVGFQLNGSADGTMLDAIPALGGSHTGTQQLYFPHIAAQ